MSDKTKDDTADWLESAPIETRIGVAACWAEHVLDANTERGSDRDVLDGTLYHLRFALTELKKRPVEQYPGELENLRDLLKAVCRLTDGRPQGDPLVEAVCDHYSDSRMVDATLCKLGRTDVL